MTQAELKKNLEVWGACFKDSTCPKLQLEIIKRIVNCKATDTNTKIAMVEQYVSNQTTNNCVIEAIKRYNR